MYSFLPVPEDRAGAIITLVGLGHEGRGYTGRLVYAQGHGIQAGYVGLTSTTSIHMNPPVEIRLSRICSCRVAAFKQQKDGAFCLNEHDGSTSNFDHVSQDRQDNLY
jgi:hypothetical protein